MRKTGNAEQLNLRSTKEKWKRNRSKNLSKVCAEKIIFCKKCSLLTAPNWSSRDLAEKRTNKCAFHWDYPLQVLARFAYQVWPNFGLHRKASPIKTGKRSSSSQSALRALLWLRVSNSSWTAECVLNLRISKACARESENFLANSLGNIEGNNNKLIRIFHLFDCGRFL